MNLLIESIQFFKNAYNEFRKVAWLDKKKIVGITVVVVIFVTIVSVFVSVVDFFLGIMSGIIL
ncbi:MAG: preprotein translocase subunit SecE [Endomicrobium sp.]|jgi:preprotein translocase subunit SecE|nr:preprotein translocase subunit SecE [Endomicrobium sp.]